MLMLPKAMVAWTGMHVYLVNMSGAFPLCRFTRAENSQTRHRRCTTLHTLLLGWRSSLQQNTQCRGKPYICERNFSHDCLSSTAQSYDRKRAAHFRRQMHDRGSNSRRVAYCVVALDRITLQFAISRLGVQCVVALPEAQGPVACIIESVVGN